MSVNQDSAIATKRLDSVDGFEIVARAYYSDDGSAQLYDADCYTEEDIAAWKDDDWTFVNVTISAELSGVELGSDTVGGIEHGTFGDGRDLDALGSTGPILGVGGYADDMIAEAVAEAKRFLATAAARVSPERFTGRRIVSDLAGHDQTFSVIATGGLGRPGEGAYTFPIAARKTRAEAMAEFLAACDRYREIGPGPSDETPPHEAGYTEYVTTDPARAFFRSPWATNYVVVVEIIADHTDAETVHAV